MEPVHNVWMRALAQAGIRIRIQITTIELGPVDVGNSVTVDDQGNADPHARGAVPSLNVRTRELGMAGDGKEPGP